MALASPAGLPHTPRAALAPLAAITETDPGYATAEGGAGRGGEERRGEGREGGRRGGIIWDGSRAGPNRAERLRPSGGGRAGALAPPRPALPCRGGRWRGGPCSGRPKTRGGATSERNLQT